MARPHLYLLAGDLHGAGGLGRGVQVARAHYVLQQVGQQGAGVSAAVYVHHVVGAAQLKQWLALCRRWGWLECGPRSPGHRGREPLRELGWVCLGRCACLGIPMGSPMHAEEWPAISLVDWEK